MNNQLAQRKSELAPFVLGSRNQITSLLEDKKKADKFIAAAMVIACDKSLSNCSPDSITQALVGVAMADLSIDKNLGQCYFIPYKDSVQLQIGYKGYIQLLFRAGWLVKSFPVFNCDKFSMEFNGWDNQVSFTPDIDNRNEGDNKWAFENLRGVYVVSRHADTKDEYSLFVSKQLIEKLRMASQNQRVGRYTKEPEKKRLNAGLPIGIWEDWYIEMAQAKAIKKLAKTLPLGDTRETKIINIDDKTDAGSTIDFKKTANDEDGSGFIIEMEPANESSGELSLDEIIVKINQSASLGELNQLTKLVENLSETDTAAIRDAWSLKLNEFKFAAEAGKNKNPDISYANQIQNAKSIDELTAILNDMPESAHIELSDVIDNKMDLMRT